VAGIFWVAWGTLLVGPPLAATLVFFTRKHRRALGLLLVSACATVLLVLTAFLAHVEFVPRPANVVALCAAYLAYCVLAFATGLFRRPLVKWPSTILAVAPIAFGYFLATVGILGLMFLIGDAVREPVERRAMGGRLICQVTTWDGIGDAGHWVDLYATWSPLPIQRRLHRLVSEQTSAAPPVSCADARFPRAAR